MQKKYIS